MNMEQNVIQRNMWNTGAVGGAVLGAVSAAYLFLSHPLGSSEMPVFISMLASGVLWLAKFAAGRDDSCRGQAWERWLNSKGADLFF